MRVLFLAHRLPYPPDKGDKIRSFRELQALARRHEVDLFCFYDQPKDRQYFPQVRGYCQEFYAEPIRWLGSRARAGLAWASGSPFTTAFFRSSSMERHICAAVAERRYDLVFVFGSAMAPYAQGFSQLPRLLDMVDVDSDKWKQYARYSRPPLSWIWTAEATRLFEYEKSLARQFSMTLLCTCSEAEILRRSVPETRIEVIENTMDTAYFDPAKVTVPAELTAWQPYVVFTGSMDYFPNADAVEMFYREVFLRIRRDLPKARFVIAGRNPTRAVRKLARDPAVLVTGAVADIRPYLRGAAAAVAPLRVARGVQTKIFEAMAMGLPIAVSSKAAIALPQCLRGQVQVEDDPQRLAAILLALLQATPRSSAGARAALLDYVEGAKWDERWEGLLTGAVQLHRKEFKDSRVALRDPEVYPMRDGKSPPSMASLAALEAMVTSGKNQEKGI